MTDLPATLAAELNCIRRMLRALETLPDDDSKRRILTYVVDKFGAKPTVITGRQLELTDDREPGEAEAALGSVNAG